MYAINIEKITNGYILKWEEEIEEKVYKGYKYVIEGEEDMNSNETMKRLLEYIAEHFGQQYDKWGKENLNITFDKEGHKYE